jgi:cytochrome b
VSAPTRQSIRVWDLPTRLFHWALAGLVTVSWLSGQFGGQPWLEWHFRFGYAILALLVFRLLWGYAGDRYARFSEFSLRRGAALGYLRCRACGRPQSAGRAVRLRVADRGRVLVVTGLCASDGDFTEGPWSVFVSDARSS